MERCVMAHGIMFSVCTGPGRQNYTIPCPNPSWWFGRFFNTHLAGFSLRADQFLLEIRATALALAEYSDKALQPGGFSSLWKAWEQGNISKKSM